jgi:hypothetical protein
MSDNLIERLKAARTQAGVYHYEEEHINVLTAAIEEILGLRARVSDQATSDAFNRLAISQRDAAWREIESLKYDLARTREAEGHWQRAYQHIYDDREGLLRDIRRLHDAEAVSKMKAEFVDVRPDSPVPDTPVPDNVVSFTGVTRLDLDPDRVLASLNGKLDSFVLCGYDKTGLEVFSSTIADGADVLWLLERGKTEIMRAAEERDGE